MMKLLILFTPFLFPACTVNNALIYAGEENIAPKMKIKILDQTSLAYRDKKGLPFSEISDLSYDKHHEKLYMIGDKGYFYIFDAKFTYQIDTLKYKKGYKIDEKKPHASYDSEGLTQDNRGNLYISFEGNPRISLISKKALLVKDLKLPKQLEKKKSYRSSNKMFEALAWHPKYGFLTATEYPLRKKKMHEQSIYALSGKIWNFKSEKHQNSAVTAIEVMDDGNLLILERAYAGLSKPFVITLKKLYLEECTKNHQCKTEILASMNSSKGWGVNNFEGLTKVGKNRYLMVSDNNNKSMLRTVFVYFEVLK